MREGAPQGYCEQLHELLPKKSFEQLVNSKP